MNPLPPRPISVSPVYPVQRELFIRVKAYPPLTLLILEGYFAQLEVYKLKRQVDELLQRGVRVFVFDLSKVDFIDSAGIGALLQTHAECTQAGGTTAYVRPGLAQPDRTLEISGLTRKLDFHPDRESALSSLAQRLGFVLPDLVTQAEAAAAAAAPVSPLDLVLKRLESIEQRLAQVERHLAARSEGSPL